jgi:DZ domain-containing protein 1
MLFTLFQGRSGLFISNLVPGGVAERAGFRLDDQLLAVNGNDMRGLGHQKAVELIRMAGDHLEVLIAREQDQQSREERQAVSRKGVSPKILKNLGLKV